LTEFGQIENAMPTAGDGFCGDQTSFPAINLLDLATTGKNLVFILLSFLILGGQPVTAANVSYTKIKARVF
jgi:hypothetical protein